MIMPTNIVCSQILLEEGGCQDISYCLKLEFMEFLN
jgi:hypothetical protein